MRTCLRPIRQRLALPVASKPGFVRLPVAAAEVGARGGWRTSTSAVAHVPPHRVDRDVTDRSDLAYSPVTANWTAWLQGKLPSPHRLRPAETAASSREQAAIPAEREGRVTLPRHRPGGSMLELRKMARMNKT